MDTKRKEAFIDLCYYSLFFLKNNNREKSIAEIQHECKQLAMSYIDIHVYQDLNDFEKAIIRIAHKTMGI